MKKIFLILIGISFIGINNALKAQPNPDNLFKPTKKNYKNLVVYYPSSLFINGLTLGYEREIKKNFSTRVIARFVSAESSSFFSVDSATEFKFEIQPRFYLGDSSESLNDFYAMPFFRVKRLDGKEPTIEKGKENEKLLRAESISIGVALGFQFISMDRISGDLYIGGHIRNSFQDYDEIGDEEQEVFTPYSKGAGFTMGFNIGVAF